MVLIFLLSFLVYLITLHPTVSVGDSGELLTAAYTLGISHPPGYPLWTLSGKIFTIIIPFGNIAYRINLMSAFFGSLTCMLVYLIVREANKHSSSVICHLSSVICPFIAALALAFSSTFWSQSIITEVYTLNAFFVALLVGILTHQPTCLANGRVNLSTLYLFAFVYGVSIANHFIMFLFGPVFLLYIIWQKEKILKLKIILSLILFSVLGMFFYIYIPVRSSLNPPIDWGNPETFRNFIAHVGRFQYRGLEFAEEVGVLTKFLFIKNLLQQLIQNFGIGLAIISVIGLIIIIKKDIKFALLTIFIFLINTLGLIVLLDFKFTPQDIDAFTPYYLPAWIMVALWIGFAGMWMAGLKRIKFGLLVVFLILAMNFVVNYKNNYNRYNFIAYDYPNNILKSIPKNGKLYLHEEVDETIFTLSYLKNVLKKRQDVSIVDSYGNIFLADDPLWQPEYYSAVNTEKIKVPLRLHGLIWAADNKTKKYHWFSHIERINHEVENYREQEVTARYPYFYGMFLIADGQKRKGVEELRKSLQAGHDLIWLNNNVGDIFRQHSYFKDALVSLDKTIQLDNTYSIAYYNKGLLYLKKKEEEKAIECFKKSYQYDKKDTDSLYQISKIYQNRGYKSYIEGKIDKAVLEYKKAAEFAPDKADIYYNIGVIYSQFDNNKEARNYFERYLELKPGGQNAETVKKWLKSN
ncbi:MAG: DUF2723 domain-containing protein [Elusimicrobia bacterium]|nr:DUF2723 domain-containing protein [Elusimicrobiota bacterium]